MSWWLVVMLPITRGVELPHVGAQFTADSLQAALGRVRVPDGYQIEMIEERDTPLLDPLPPEAAARVSASFLNDRARRARATASGRGLPDQSQQPKAELRIFAMEHSVSRTLRTSGADEGAA